MQELVKDFEREALGLTSARSVWQALQRPLVELLEDFVAELKTRGRTAGTLRKYHGTLKLLFEQARWRELREVTARPFVQRRNGCGLEPKSVNDLLANAHGFFRWLKQQKLALEDPSEAESAVSNPGVLPKQAVASEMAKIPCTQICAQNGAQTGVAGRRELPPAVVVEI